MAAVPRRDDGQMLPIVAMLLVGIIGLGVLAVAVGRATVMRSDAQTAADAAALAAARNIRDQLNAQVAATGTSSLELVNDLLVQAAAARYAALNDAHLRRPVERTGTDVKVWVATNRKLGKGAPTEKLQDEHGQARARARLELVPLFTGGAGFGGGGGGQPPPSGGKPKISDDEWDALEKQLKHHPPQCSSNADESDLYLLGLLLQKHGFTTLANAQLQSPPTHGQHSETGWHFQCADSGAIDLNFDCCGQDYEDSVINPLLEPLHRLGFRTIWKSDPIHQNHMHIDTGNGPPLGVGGVASGAAGPLQDSFLEIRLIDWDAPAAIYRYPLGLGDPGPNPFGPPDPGIASLTCQLMAKYHVNPTVRLALWEALIVESGVHNLPDGDDSSVGVLQALDIHGSYQTRMNPVWQIEKFLLYGFTMNIGAIRWQRMHPERTPGQIAQDIQGSDFPFEYDKRESQAIALNRQFCGGEGL